MLQGSLNVSPILEGSNLMQICGNFDGFPPKKMCIVSVGNIMTSVFLNAKIRYLIWHEIENTIATTWRYWHGPFFRLLWNVTHQNARKKIEVKKSHFKPNKCFTKSRRFEYLTISILNPSQVCYAGWCWIWVLRARWRRWGSTPRALVFKCMCQRCRGLRRVTPPCAPEAAMYTIFYYNDFYSFHMI